MCAQGWSVYRKYLFRDPGVCAYACLCAKDLRVLCAPTHMCTLCEVRMDPCAEDLGLEWSAGGPVCTEVSTSAFL